MSNQSLYRRGETWYLRATIKGREYRESLHTNDARLARKRRDERLTAIEGAVRFGEVKHTWEEGVTAWAAHAQGQIGRSTLKRYGVSLTQVFQMLTGKDISSISGETIQNLMSVRRQAGATPATIRRDLTAISRVLEHAEALGWREGNPTLSKRRLLKERRDPITLPDAHSISAVLRASSTRFAALISAALLTGCRQEELSSLTWKQYDNKTGTLEIIGKGNKRRTIQLSEEARRHMDGTPRHYASPYIFCTADTGERFTQAASDFCHFRRIAAAKDKGFKRFRFHDLRHLFAVEALRSGMGIYRLSKHLGHTSVKTTEIYLSFLTPDQAEQAKARAA